MYAEDVLRLLDDCGSDIEGNSDSGDDEPMMVDSDDQFSDLETEGSCPNNSEISTRCTNKFLPSNRYGMVGYSTRAYHMHFCSYYCATVHCKQDA